MGPVLLEIYKTRACKKICIRATYTEFVRTDCTRNAVVPVGVRSSENFKYVVCLIWQSYVVWCRRNSLWNISYEESDCHSHTKCIFMHHFCKTVVLHKTWRFCICNINSKGIVNQSWHFVPLIITKYIKFLLKHRFYITDMSEKYSRRYSKKRVFSCICFSSKCLLSISPEMQMWQLHNANCPDQ